MFKPCPHPHSLIQCPHPYHHFHFFFQIWSDCCFYPCIALSMPLQLGCPDCLHSARTVLHRAKRKLPHWSCYNCAMFASFDSSLLPPRLPSLILKLTPASGTQVLYHLSWPWIVWPACLTQYHTRLQRAKWPRVPTSQVTRPCFLQNAGRHCLGQNFRSSGFILLDWSSASDSQHYLQDRSWNGAVNFQLTAL